MFSQRLSSQAGGTRGSGLELYGNRLTARECCLNQKEAIDIALA